MKQLEYLVTDNPYKESNFVITTVSRYNELIGTWLRYIRYFVKIGDNLLTMYCRPWNTTNKAIWLKREFVAIAVPKGPAFKCLFPSKECIFSLPGCRIKAKKTSKFWIVEMAPLAFVTFRIRRTAAIWRKQLVARVFNENISSAINRSFCACALHSRRQFNVRERINRTLTTKPQLKSELTIFPTQGTGPTKSASLRYCVDSIKCENLHFFWLGLLGSSVCVCSSNRF